MYFNRLILYYIIFASLINTSAEFIFLRTIEAVGFPYYKLLLSLGECKENILYSERKIWPQVRMNRVFDIFYISERHNILVSRVELRLVINDTSCQAYSVNGVGHREFAATLFLPTNLATVFSSMTIFTCTKDTLENNTNEVDVQMPFYVKRRVV